MSGIQLQHQVSWTRESSRHLEDQRTKLGSCECLTRITFTFTESFSSSFGSCECVVYDKDCHQDGQDDENGNHHHDHGQDTFSRRSSSSDSPFHFHVNFHFQSSVDPTSWSVIVPLDLAPGHFPASAKSPQAKYEHCNALFTMPSMNIVSKRTLALEDFDIFVFQC